MLRFSLRYMFWCVTGLCVLLAALVAVPIGMAAVALLLAVSVVVLHVLSTAIGTRLGEHANDRRAWEANRDLDERPAGVPPARDAHEVAAPFAAPRTRSAAAADADVPHGRGDSGRAAGSGGAECHDWRSHDSGGDFGGCRVDGGRGGLDCVCGGERVEHLSPRVRDAVEEDRRK